MKYVPTPNAIDLDKDHNFVLKKLLIFEEVEGVTQEWLDREVNTACENIVKKYEIKTKERINIEPLDLTNFQNN